MAQVIRSRSARYGLKGANHDGDDDGAGGGGQALDAAAARYDAVAKAHAGTHQANMARHVRQFRTYRATNQRSDSETDPDPRSYPPKL